MTIDHESVTEKKAKLQQAIRVLQKLRKYSLDELMEDEIAIGSVLHYLTVSIEAILDIGSHILTEDFAVSPATYEDIIVMLGTHNIIDKDLSKAASGVGKFRNKMIHEYVGIDIQKVYTYLQAAPEQFQQFDDAFSAYISRTM